MAMALETRPDANKENGEKFWLLFVTALRVYVLGPSNKEKSWVMKERRWGLQSENTEFRNGLLFRVF